jgi:hypothetical protein
MTSPHVQDSSIPTPKTLPNRFIFVACQQGAEVPFKNRYMGKYTPFRLAFSRPGLVTFKISYDQDPAKLRPQWLARLVGEGVGNVRGLVAQESVEKTLELAGTDFQAIHIFQRDRALPGQHDFARPDRAYTIDRGTLWTKVAVSESSSNFHQCHLPDRQQGPGCDSGRTRSVVDWPSHRKGNLGMLAGRRLPYVAATKNG